MIDELSTPDEIGPSWGRCMDKPPRLVHVAILLAALLLVVAVAWAYCCRMESCIRGRGSVRPLGDLVRVQPLVGGRLFEVRVAEGDAVAEGALLFRFDDRDKRAELNGMRERCAASQRHVELIRRACVALRKQQELELERDQLEVQRAHDELEAAKTARAQQAATLEQVQAQLDEANSILGRTRQLVQSSLTSAADLDSKEAARRGAEAAAKGAAAGLESTEQGILISQRSLELSEKRARIAAQERERVLVEEEMRLLAEEEAQQQLLLETESRRSALDGLEVHAPVAGTVVFLASKNPGEVIEPGVTMATICPESSPLVVESFIPMRDAGQLPSRIGGRVLLKFDALPFREYGVGEGRLLSVAPDASVDPALGPTYGVRVAIDSLLVGVGRKEGRIRLGMTASVDVVIEDERILSFLYREVRSRTSLD